MTREVAIVGGALAGSAAAIRLARAGDRVTLFEKDTFPRDKLCGEFLSPESERELRELGALQDVLAVQPARIDRFRFTGAAGRSLDGALPSPAIGISRRALDRILFTHAGLAGARALSGCEVRSIAPHGSRLRVESELETLDADLVICAHGRRSRLDKALGRPFMNVRSPFAALKRHFRPRRPLPDLEGHVEIHTYEGGYCGFSFVEGGLVNSCTLVQEDVLVGLEGRGGRSSWDVLAAEMGARNEAIARRLEQLEPADSDVHAVAQIHFGAKERAQDGVIFIGDAAAMIAPFAGDGQAMALESARVVAQLARGTDDRRVLAARWNRAFEDRFSIRVALADQLQRMLLHKSSAALALWAVGAIPGLAPLLVRWTRG